MNVKNSCVRACYILRNLGDEQLQEVEQGRGIIAMAIRIQGTRGIVPMLKTAPWVGWGIPVLEVVPRAGSLSTKEGRHGAPDSLQKSWLFLPKLVLSGQYLRCRGYPLRKRGSCEGAEKWWYFQTCGRNSGRITSRGWPWEARLSIQTPWRSVAKNEAKLLAVVNSRAKNDRLALNP